MQTIRGKRQRNQNNARDIQKTCKGKINIVNKRRQKTIKTCTQYKREKKQRNQKKAAKNQTHANSERRNRIMRGRQQIINTCKQTQNNKYN